jgi:hypothetical protein
MTSEVDRFLSRFFGDGNAISLAQARATADLNTLIEAVTDDLEVPAVLPRRLDAEEVEWFVLTGDDASLRRTQDELLAFIGPTYGRWDSIRGTLLVTDPVEAAVLEFCDGRAIRFRTQGPDEFKECWVAIQLMRRVWAQRPRQRAEQIRTGAALVREFELAVAAGDTETSEETLRELSRRGLLSAENFRFLEIRSLAAQGRWAEISAAADLPDLAMIPRPWLVTEDILTALYRTYFSALENDGATSHAIDEAHKLVGRLPDLFSSRGPLQTPDVVKLFALQSAAAEMADADRILEFLDISDLTPADRRWITAVAEDVRGPVQLLPVRDARGLLTAGDVDGAFRLAAHERDLGATEILLECAFELQTLESAATALEALDGLSSPDRDSLLERRLIAGAVKHLRALVQPSEVGDPAAPNSWSAWFDRLRHDSGWQAAAAVAACGELEFGAIDVVDPPTASRLAELVTMAADSDERGVVRDALPHIVGWLERQNCDLAIIRPIHAAILTVLALDSAWGDAALEVAYNCTEAVLGGGVDKRGYAELLEELSLLWERMAARRHVAWLADLLELLELFPGPREPLISFAAGALALVHHVLPRVSGATLEALRASLLGVGADQLVATIPVLPLVEDNEDLPTLAGQLVGIYTLTPQVAVRAKRAIERRFPGVRVEVDSSHVSTPSLEHLAASADYMIVSIRSAKHAATDAIDRCRPQSRPTIIPGGRGSSRMVEALVSSLSYAH